MTINFERDVPGSGPVITGFAGNAFRIDGIIFSRGALLTPRQALHWNAPLLVDVSLDDLDPVLALDPIPEFIVIGTGAHMVRPARSLATALEARGIGVEAMDSRAAARAWGVLRSEDRWIVAALLPL